RENAVLWEEYLIAVRKYTTVATNFEFILNEPAYWTYIGAEDAKISLETMIERCLNLTHRSQIQEGKSLWTALSWEENKDQEGIAIGTRLRYGRGQKPVVHHFGGVPV